MEHLQQLNPFYKEHDLRGLNPLNGVIDALTTIKARPVVTARKSGETMDIRKMLIYARDRGMWVIAFDSGAYTLSVDPYRINIDVCKTEEFQEVLSHLREPALNTTFGPMPKNMMKGMYLRPTWVDFLNHFNIPEFRLRVDRDLGAVFAQKKCRALYLERDVPFHVQVAACARTRLWQELGVGPQAHQYGSVEAVWLHFVAAVGEVVSSYAAADLQSISKILTDIANGETEEIHRKKHRHDKGDAVAKVFREFCNGSLQSFVSQVFRVKGWARSEDFVAALTGNMRGLDVRDATLHVARVVQAVTVVIHESVQALAKYKKSDGSGWTDNTHAITDVHGHHFPAALRRSGVLSIDMSKKAANGILSQTQDGWRVTSAVSNFSNRNATAETERVSASFSVLCAQRNVPCTPAAISDLIYSEENVDVACLPASQCAGIGAVQVKKVGFKKIGEKPSARHVGPEGLDLLSKVVTGELLEMSECDQVWVSGLTLDKCTLAVKKPLIGDKGNITKWFAKKDELGELLGFRIQHDEVTQLRLRLDDGSFVSVISNGGIYRQRFRQWHANLPPAEGDDFGWL